MLCFIHQYAFLNWTETYSRKFAYRGFALQPCCMAGTIDSFSYGKKSFFLCKIFSLFLPCNMAAVQNLYYMYIMHNIIQNPEKHMAATEWLVKRYQPEKLRQVPHLDNYYCWNLVFCRRNEAFVSVFVCSLKDLFSDCQGISHCLQFPSAKQPILCL